MGKRYALIIEDNADLAQLCSLALQPIGFETEVALTGERATQQLKGRVPDVVVLDLHLPGISGMDILQQIRSDPRLEKTQVIVTTADPRTAELVQESADLVLIKPISLVQVRDLAARLGLAAGPADDE